MNAPLTAPLERMHVLAERIGQACARIAPTWPLDEFIAVNPYWGWVHRPVDEAAAWLALLAGTRLTMPRAEMRRHWAEGRLGRPHLEQALRLCAARVPAGTDVARLEQALHAEAPAIAPLPLVPALRDARHAPEPMPWGDLVTHQISQHCAAFFDRHQARWHLDGSAGLFASWRAQLAADRGLPWTQGRRAMLARLEALPRAPLAAIEHALAALGMPAEAELPYLSALLLSVNGWAAWCAYERWQARLASRDDDRIVELLALRLAWEWLLAADAPPGHLLAAWTQRWAQADAQIALAVERQRLDWLLQFALELADQQPLCEGLLRAAPPAEAAPEVQAVFCIDVRSEVLRRALEAVAPAVHTRGFAGFFGLPIAYAPAGSALERPQLPGLLAPALTASEAPDPGDDAGRGLGQHLAAARQAALGWRRRWAELRGSAASGFSFVETCGLAYGPKLVAASLPSTRRTTRWEDTGLPEPARGRAPALPLRTTADTEAAARMLQGILGAMGLVREFAPLVLLAGHGSQTANNPHAAGLDCGACGGQAGEVNARLLAALLNDPALRRALAARGIAIPAGTHFLPGLHNTTTDDVLLYDTDAVPPAHHERLAALRAALAEAGARARAERAGALGLEALAGDAPALKRSIRERANDWAQVRPEWGLADNAAFIVAPRRRTRHLNLGGRSFLHDYDWRDDAGLGVLELIMTAPMVVTNWINLQYHASTVDNRRYGSGNKVLHNVVGGRLGVFEGNGGDLRIGLPLQSLHDGTRWRHTALRLAVFVEAPRAMIDTVVARHAVVANLVDNGWLHLLRIDPDAALVERRIGGAWTVAARG